MRIRRVVVENFRGLKSLDFRIPADKKFVCLVGPGDSAKSTIIDAIHLALGDRWSLSLSDTDFYATDVTSPIVIRVAVGDLPADIRGHSTFGMHLSGIDASGEWQHDPVTGYEPCVIIELKVDADLEPQWTIHRPTAIDGPTVGVGLRRKFMVAKIDERIDNHLRWTRTSALARLTDATHGASGTLAGAVLAARGAVAAAITPELQGLTDDIGNRIREIGGGDFSALKPGLDTSLASSGGNLALFDDAIPLTSFGLGTRRLAGIATQQMAADNKAVILVDEVEHGLEPHRVVHLLKHLKSDGHQAQVLVTTHSPVAVEQLDSSDLAIVRCVAGAGSASFVPAGLRFAQAALRSGPSSFLARRVVVTEGKTEFGMLLGLVDAWDAAAAAAGTPTSASLGVAIANGEGSNSPNRANVLATLGYSTALFIDNDVRSIDSDVATAAASGVQVFRWQAGMATEDDLVSALTAPQLDELLLLAIDSRVDEHTVRSDLLNNLGAENPVPDLSTAGWMINHGYTIDTARALVARAAKKCKWFKTVPAGQSLAAFLGVHSAGLASTPFGYNITAIKNFIYSPVT